MTADIITAHLSRTPATPDAVPNLIRSVHAALWQTIKGQEAAAPKPAVPVSKSITDAYLICLEDGAKLKALKRYLRTRYGLTPAEYREKWGLPKTYPMTAPASARRRSEIAKSTGLGRKRAKRKK